MDENLDLNKNIEIEKALQEFEEKSSTEETQKPPEAGEASDIPKMTRLVMKWSGVKEQRQAEYILIGFVIITVAISIFLFLKGNPSSNVKTFPEDTASEPH